VTHKEEEKKLDTGLHLGTNQNGAASDKTQNEGEKIEKGNRRKKFGEGAVFPAFNWEGNY